MKPAKGLWIDHRQAVIVTVTDEGEEVRKMKSNAERQPRRAAGARPGGPFEPQAVPADDRRQREYAGELDRYYDRVAAQVRGAGAILILGPGEAKDEFRKRIERDPEHGRIVGVETADKMTDPQLLARVRDRFRERIAERRNVE